RIVSFGTCLDSLSSFLLRMKDLVVSSGSNGFLKGFLKAGFKSPFSYFSRESKPRPPPDFGVSVPRVLPDGFGRFAPPVVYFWSERDLSPPVLRVESFPEKFFLSLLILF